MLPSGMHSRHGVRIPETSTSEKRLKYSKLSISRTSPSGAQDRHPSLPFLEADALKWADFWDPRRISTCFLLSLKKGSFCLGGRALLPQALYVSFSHCPTTLSQTLLLPRVDEPGVWPWAVKQVVETFLAVLLGMIKERREVFIIPFHTSWMPGIVLDAKDTTVYR